MIESKFTFSGHETFHCRPLWLHKGFHFLKNGNKFNDPDAVVELGVGKNMVQAIHYWLKAFNIIDSKNDFTNFGLQLFDVESGDQYFENENTYWLLHYHLVKTNFASTYNLFFNQFKKDRYEFSKDQLIAFLKRICHQNNVRINESSLQKDISVFFRNYLVKEKATKNLEDVLSGLFYELDLIYELPRVDKEAKIWYSSPNKIRKDLSPKVFLFTILDNPIFTTNAIDVVKLTAAENSPGRVFCMNSEGVIEKVRELIALYNDITYSDDAGIKQLIFLKKPDKQEILNDCFKG